MPLPEGTCAGRLCWPWLLSPEGPAHTWRPDGASKCKFREASPAARCQSVRSGT